jgi:membrane carboxypeptidase/penicillin-binding protein
MGPVLGAKPVADFPKPDTVISLSIDPGTGKLATSGCPVKREEFYIVGTEPTEYCPVHGGNALEPSPAIPPMPSDGGEIPEKGE